MNIPDPLFTGKNAIFLEQVPSTNTFAMDLIAKTNPPEGTCIFTAFQSDGRGQIGRYWYSSNEKNVLTSYIFYPKWLKATDQFVLNIISGLAVRDVVANFCPDVKIKWPNDIYVNNKKIAGILVQNILKGTDIKATVIGIGLNVNEADFPNEIPNPISLKKITKIDHDLSEIRHILSTKLEIYYLKLKAGRVDWLRETYLSHLYKINKPCKFIDLDNQEFTGKICGIDDHGKLMIESLNGNIDAYGFREIKFVI